jgi:hypothetical protein
LKGISTDSSVLPFANKVVLREFISWKQSSASAAPSPVMRAAASTAFQAVVCLLIKIVICRIVESHNHLVKFYSFFYWQQPLRNLHWAAFHNDQTTERATTFFIGQTSQPIGRQLWNTHERIRVMPLNTSVNSLFSVPSFLRASNFNFNRNLSEDIHKSRMKRL